MKTHHRILGLVAALLISSPGLWAQTTGTGTTPGKPATMPPGATDNPGTATTTTTPPTTPPATPGKAAPHTVNEHASDNAKAVQAVLQKFDATRDQIIADRKALIDKLQAAKTDAERKAILDQLRTENSDQRALGKEIRDELKKLRDQRAKGGS